MTTIHLLRHASYDGLGQVIAGRAPGYVLNAAGLAEAARLAASLALLPLVAILSSPLERARQTATIIAARHGLDVLPEPGLTDIDFGAWTGLSLAALQEAPGWAAWNAFRGTAPIPGGESMLQAQTRAVGALAGLARRFPDAEVAAVSHADIIKALVVHALGAPLDLLHRIEIAPASRSVIALSEAEIRVLAVNLPA